MSGGSKEISMDDMRQHLQGVFIGHRPGDPSAAALPASMPPPTVPPAAGHRTVDLRRMTQSQLHAEAAATLERDPFEVLLADPPGVPPGRIAYLSGQAPAEQQQRQQQQEAKQQQKAKQQQAQQSGRPKKDGTAPTEAAAAAARLEQQQQQQQQQQGASKGAAAVRE